MNVYSQMKSSGIGSVVTNASTPTALSAQVSTRVIVCNTAASAVAVTVYQAGSSAGITIQPNATFTFNGIRDASVLSIQASTGTPTVSYRWEH